MGLVKCPDCGNMVSERAANCIKCGCPSQFFISEENSDNKATEENKTATAEANTEKKIDAEENKKIIFNLGPKEICYYEKHIPFAKLFGKYYKCAADSYDVIRDKYNEAKDIADVVSFVIPEGKALLDRAIDSMIKDLYFNGINISFSQFWNDNSLLYDFDYDRKTRDVKNSLINSMELQGDLEDEEALRRANRGQWVGGGFGIKGAIKGSIQASLLNTGSSIIHSFGDASRANKIENIVQEDMVDKKNNVFNRLAVCYSLHNCIINAFWAFTDILKDNNFSIPKMNFKDADTTYENASKYAKNNKSFYVDELIKCITNNPGEKTYYDSLIPFLYDYPDHELDKFIKFWNVEFLYPNYENDLAMGRNFDQYMDKMIEPLLQDDDELPLDKDTYIKVRRICNDFLTENNSSELPSISKYNRELGSYFDNFSDIIKQNIYLINDYTMIDSFPQEITLEEYFNRLRIERSAYESPLSYAWIIGDSYNNINVKYNETKSAFGRMRNGAICFYIDTASFIDRVRGIILTYHYFVDLKNPNNSISYNEVNNIVVNEKNIEIYGSHNKVIILKCECFPSQDYLNYLVKLFRVICVRFGDNMLVWEEDMITPKPIHQAQASKAIIKENITCPSCGKSIYNTDLFCGYCGSKVSDNGQKQNTAPPQKNVVIIKDNSNLEKKLFDTELDKELTIDIDFNKYDIENYNKLRKLQLTGKFPKINKMPASSYYRKETSNFLLGCIFNAELYKDIAILNTIPSIDLDGFINFIKLDLTNFGCLCLENVWLKNRNVTNWYNTGEEHFNRIRMKTLQYPANGILLYNTDFFSTAGVYITDRYLFFPDKNVYIPNNEVTYVGYNHTLYAEYHPDDILIRCNRFDMVVKKPSFDKKTLKATNSYMYDIDGTQYFDTYEAEKGTTVYLINLIKNILYRFGGNTVLSMTNEINL